VACITSRVRRVPYVTHQGSIRSLWQPWHNARSLYHWSSVSRSISYGFALTGDNRQGCVLICSTAHRSCLPLEMCRGSRKPA